MTEFYKKLPIDSQVKTQSFLKGFVKQIGLLDQNNISKFVRIDCSNNIFCNICGSDV